jgi:superfamily II DNA or RNA helicase
MIQLHDFQISLEDRIREAFRSTRRVLAVSPTGSGKTVVFADMTLKHLKVRPHGRVMILVHRAELVEQVVGALRRIGIDPGVIAGGHPMFLARSVQVASVFTLVSRLNQIPKPTLLIIDEAHHAVGRTTWGQIGAYYAGIHTLGVTATPTRQSGEGLSECFDEMVMGPTTRELIARGFLARPKVFAPPTADLSKVRTNMREFVRGQLAKIMDVSSITGNAVDTYKRHASGKKFVLFAVSVDHAKHAAQQFTEAGIPCAHVDGGMSREVRAQTMDDYRSDRLLGMASCDLISEGFDVPDIVCGISLRPTQSLGLWLQQVGRCLRTAPGKTHAVILDHAGNTLRHGMPDDEIEWSLHGAAVVKKEGAVRKARTCPVCFAASSASGLKCENCGAAFPVAPRVVKERKGELEELTPERAAELKAMREKRRQNGMAASTKGIEGLTELGRMRGYKDPEGWARHVMESRSRRAQ